MTSSSRQQLVGKMHKALRSQYKPIVPNTNRSVLEQVLFACCLENAPYDVAEKALARLGANYFDLNEVRVTTVAELAETLHDLPDPAQASLALRRVLQGVFESSYSFSLENAKKHSIAHGIKTLEHLHGIPPFVVAFVTATGLSGHCVPLDRGALSALLLAGIISQAEYDSGKVLGLERLVPKKAGVEFGSLLHQFGVEVLSNLHGATVKKILLRVNPAVKDRFPKRGESLPAPKPPAAPAGKQAQRAAEAAQTAAEEHRPAGPQAAARPPGKTPLPPPGSGPKRTADGQPIINGKPGPKPFVVKPNVGRPPVAVAQPVSKQETQKKSAATKPVEQKSSKAPISKPVAGKSSGARQPKPKASAGKPTKKPVPAKKPLTKSSGRHSAELSRRKPR